MPYRLSKTDGKYRVSSPHSVKSKGTSLKKAIKQRRLLNALKHGGKLR